MNERRAVPRIDCRWSVCVLDERGALLGLCKTSNISNKGAKLTMQGRIEVPNLFFVSFSVNGKVARQCKVVWRTGRDVGVRFTGSERAA